MIAGRRLCGRLRRARSSPVIGFLKKLIYSNGSGSAVKTNWELLKLPSWHVK